MNEKFQFAWSKVKDAYFEARINSERTLQAVLYSHLVPLLSSEEIAICEPVISLRGKNSHIPDMVVIRENDVIAAVELKFVPHAYPRFRDDLEKLKTYAQSQDPQNNFPLLLKPSDGKFDDRRRFIFAPDCLLVFGVVGQHDAEAVHEQILVDDMRDYNHRFVPLVLKVGSPHT